MVLRLTVRHTVCFQRVSHRRSPVWIKQYPYLSERSAASSSSEERSRSDNDHVHVHGTVKCKIHGSKGTRKKGVNSADCEDDAAPGGCDGRNSSRKHRACHCGCRHRRQRRRRLGKVHSETTFQLSCCQNACIIVIIFILAKLLFFFFFFFFNYLDTRMLH
ncbi:hypothetical protein E2986_12004 [Frieseomelitta varia]|uniref:Uncharacterized protein n=1 Tax=Frieseomelitta varia TaxID=561572 RepID=A0A833VMY3_9HYME|nr:hypothetical protein E2986_12004 [Frieseomelitta varia]